MNQLLFQKFNGALQVCVWRKGPGLAPAATPYKLPAIWRK